ncbi:MAG: acetate kinase [Kiritimatiellae bacterium]|jgi:acetate kinase|nr:acetate kinase [Kiritimatiellia bacterium]
MKVLVINAGSSSIKYQLIELDNDFTLCSGLVEKIGEDTGNFKHKYVKNGEDCVLTKETVFPDHKAGMLLIVDLLVDKDVGVIADKSEIEAVGHRIVHGGETFFAPALINEATIEGIRIAVPLAPLHNPGHLMGIEVAMNVFENVPQVAVFDTAFHQTMPKKAYIYPLPMSYYTDYGVRRYGMHGTSHQYITEATAAYLNKPIEETTLISLHLGNGASVAAVKNGKCVDTSMGLTPLAGVMMGTRCGDIDPSIHAFLARNYDIDPLEFDSIMNKESGLKGIVGTNDMREVIGLMQAGNEEATLGFEMFCYRIKKYIGTYSAILGKVDAIVFTAGIGENNPLIRSKCCEGLENMGIIIDEEKDYHVTEEHPEINTEDSPVKILVLPTAEELQIARKTLEVVNASR